MKRRMRDKSGFTLVEAMVSIALLTVLLLAFTLMVATSSRMNTASQDRQRQLETALDAVYLRTEGTTVNTAGTATITVGEHTEQVDVTIVQSNEGDVTLSYFE